MVVNQSDKGMRLWLRQPVKVGEQIGLVVRRGNARTARKATVVWIRRTIAGYAAGVTFD
jgi:hypothetical protein